MTASIKRLKELYESSRDTVRLKVIISLLSSYVSQAFNTGVNLLARLLLARMILPEDWGLFAEALFIITVCGAVRDLGMPLHLIRDNGRKYGSALILETGMSILVIAAVWLLAPLAAGLDSRLPWLLRIFALVLLPEGLATIPRAFLEKELQVNKALACELLQITVFAGISIIMGLRGYGVWSLVAGHSIGIAIYAVFLWIRTWRSIPLDFAPAHIPLLIRQGSFLFLNGLVGVSLGYIDNGILGSLVTSREVGYYFIAYTWAFLPSKLLFPSMYRIIYPTMAHYTDDADRQFNIYRLGTIILLAIELPVLAIIAINAELYVQLLLGDKWLPSVPMLRIIAFGPALVPFSRFGAALLKVHHRDRLFFVSSAIGLISLVGFGWYLTVRFRAMGMAYANLISLGSLLQLYGLGQMLRRRLFGLARDLFYIYSMCFGAFALLWLGGHHLGHFQLLAASMFCAAAVWFGYYRLFGEEIKQLFDIRLRTQDEQAGSKELA